MLELMAKPRNRKWRLILRTCCPPPAAALRAAYARAALRCVRARFFSLFLSVFPFLHLFLDFPFFRFLAVVSISLCGSFVFFFRRFTGLFVFSFLGVGIVVLIG